MGLRVVQLVISTAATFVMFVGLDDLNLPLAIGALAVGWIAAVVIALIRRADNRERRRAGLPRAASATFGVALAFFFLQLVGYAGAGAVVWANDTCTMQVGSHNANIRLTGFFSKAVCQQVEGSSQNRVLGFLGGLNNALSQVPLVGRVFGAVGSGQFHDSSPSGPEVCSGWYRQARWVVVTVRDQGLADYFGNSMCDSLKTQGLLTYPWEQ